MIRCERAGVLTADGAVRGKRTAADATLLARPLSRSGRTPRSHGRNATEGARRGTGVRLSWGGHARRASAIRALTALNWAVPSTGAAQQDGRVHARHARVSAVGALLSPHSVSEEGRLAPKRCLAAFPPQRLGVLSSTTSITEPRRGLSLPARRPSEGSRWKARSSTRRSTAACSA